MSSCRVRDKIALDEDEWKIAIYKGKLSYIDKASTIATRMKKINKETFRCYLWTAHKISYNFNLLA